LNFTFTATAGMDLCLYYTPIRLVMLFNFLGRLQGLLGRFCYESFLYGYTVFLQDFFGLILVDIHVDARMLDYCDAKITNFDPIKGTLWRFHDGFLQEFTQALWSFTRSEGR